MKRLLILFCIVFLMGNIIALEDLGTFKQGETVRISQVCSDASYITLSSITFPNSTIAISNINMTSSGSGEFYYNFANTTDLGRYDVRGISDGCEETFVTYFEVTPSGQVFGTGQVLGGLGIFIGVLAVAFAFMFIGSKLGKEEKTLPIGFFFMVMAVFLVIYSLHLAWIFSNDILQHEIISSGVSTIFVVVIWSTAGITIIFFVFMLMAFIKELSKILEKKKFGEGWNPLTHTYE